LKIFINLEAEILGKQFQFKVKECFRHGCETKFFNAMQMAVASGKAALARAQSKTCRFFGGGGNVREASAPLWPRAGFTP